MFDIMIIGAGISGTSIARELSRYKLKIGIIDKESDVANGSTKANSAIVHAGYDPKPGTLMAKYNALGNAMYENLCRELHVAFKKCGSLVLAFNNEEMKQINELYKRGLENRIPDLHIIGKEEVLSLEPNIQDNVIGALYSKTAGIVGPWELAIAMAEDAVLNGAELFLNEEVKSIKKIEKEFLITTDLKDLTTGKSLGKREYKTKKIINCAGVYADKIHNMICKESYKITPRKGEYYVMDKTQGTKIKRTIFQCPTNLGKGILLTPTVHGNLLVGPDSQDIEDKEDLSTSADRLAFVREHSLKSSDVINFRDSIRTFSGLRAEVDRGDFVIEEAKDIEGFYDVAGIKSPGLTAAPAIAIDVVEMIKKSDLEIERKEKLIAHTPHKIFMNLTQEEKEEYIKNDSSYGRMICRCEMITEGEIRDCIKRVIGARTIDAVKRRTRPGTGRCQGGFCGPRVQEIISRELGVKLEEIVLDKQGSYVLTEETKK